MGTSVAGGYVTADGSITPWLNELAFVPIDYRENAPVDEWSGDRGCAVQYFCQQGVACQQKPVLRSWRSNRLCLNQCKGKTFWNHTTFLRRFCDSQLTGCFFLP